MFDLIVRAAKHEPLTAAERATLKALQNFVIGLIATVLSALVAELASGKELNVTLLASAGVSALYIILNTGQKYLSAKGETAESELLAATEKIAQEKLPVEPLQGTATTVVPVDATTAAK